MADISTNKPDILIGQALRDLALEMPLRSAWPALVQQLPKKKSPRYFPLALAAGIALLAIIPLSLNSPHSIQSTTSAQLQSAMQQSSELENILVATRNSTASNASAEVISLALEDRIHSIDSELGADALSPKQQLDLWQRRVSLLQEASVLFATQRYQQAEGNSYDIALVESF